MAKKKSLGELSASELFSLAQKKEKEEATKVREKNKQEIEALRKKRRETVAKHRKELNQLDSKIRKLGGRSGRKTSRSSNNLSESIVSIVSKAGKLSIKELKASLADKGITANNLNQTLAYLKRMGRLKSPARSIYSVTKK